MATHACPDCGAIHMRIDVGDIPHCTCGHLAINHDNDGGKRKRAPCTVWVHVDGLGISPMVQCPCKELVIR